MSRCSEGAAEAPPSLQQIFASSEREDPGRARGQALGPGSLGEESTKAWTLIPGPYTILLGFSVSDNRIQKRLDLP
jgi:hypothetical protein